MRTTVVHRRPPPRPASLPNRNTVAARAAGEPWSTPKVGIAVSAVAAVAAVLLDAATDLSIHVIVLAVMIVGFAVSCRVTARRHHERPHLEHHHLQYHRRHRHHS